MKRREYLRCPECLGVWSVDLEIADAVEQPHPTSRHQSFRAALQPFLEGGCPWCEADTTPEDMGEVVADSGRLETTEVVPECDGRCTHAGGPLCVCRCGCKNHGMGFLAYVERRSDNGKLRTRFNAAPKNVEAARARAVEWQEIRAELHDRQKALDAEVEALRAKRRTGAYLTGPEYHVYSGRARVEIKKVIDMRSHASRMKAARKLLGKPEVTGGAA